jgi:hypothetical protein
MRYFVQIYNRIIKPLAVPGSGGPAGGGAPLVTPVMQFDDAANSQLLAVLDDF